MPKTISTLSLACFVLLAEPLRAIAQQSTQPASPQQWYGCGPWQGSHFWWVFPLMMLLMMVGFGIFFFARGPWSAHRHHWGRPGPMMDRMWGSPSHSALEVLNERFARGEIDKAEYEDKKAAILSSERY